MLGLYLHIPFCQAICGYCNFNRGLFDADLKARYVAALIAEIRAAGHAQDRRPADTIFFGGGTPSLLDAEDVAALIEACRATFEVSADAEITLETNPETATRDRLRGFLEAGINRISFGVQSFDDDELRRLGRIHSAARAEDALRAAREAGCTNLSVDLMLWLPGQSRASWARTVARTVSLEPDHISLYLLELYPNAPLKEAMARAAQPAIQNDTAGVSRNTAAIVEWAQVSDDDAADMYLDALDRLGAAGYAQYEISNVARPGRASRHNLKYWQSGDWYGFGCGAHSTVDGVRWKNTSGTSEYIDRIQSGRTVALDLQHLSPRARMEEALFTGLRLNAGIDRGNFQAQYGVDPWATYGKALEPYVEAGAMWVDDRCLGLTRQGMLVANEVLLTFV